MISSAQEITAYQHVHYLAETGESVLGLAQALEIERTDTAQFVILGPLYGGRGAQRSSAEYLLEKRVMQRTYSATDKRAAQVMRRAGAIGGSYPAPVRAEAREEVTAIRGLSHLRLAAPVERASTEEAVAVAAASGSGAPAGPTAANASTGLGYQFNGLRVLEVELSSSVTSQAAARHGAAEVSIAVFGALRAVLVLLLALIFLPAWRHRRPPAG